MFFLNRLQVPTVDRDHRPERSVPLVATTEMSPAGITTATQGITTPGIGTGSTETIAESDQGAEMHMQAEDMIDPGSQAEIVNDIAETAGTTMTAETLVVGVAAGITAGMTHAVPTTRMTLTRETEAGAETGTVEDRLMVATNASVPRPGAGPEAEKEDAIHSRGRRGQGPGLPPPPKMSEAHHLSHLAHHRITLREQ